MWTTIKPIKTTRSNAFLCMIALLIFAIGLCIFPLIMGPKMPATAELRTQAERTPPRDHIREAYTIGVDRGIELGLFLGLTRASLADINQVKDLIRAGKEEEATLAVIRRVQEAPPQP